ncbi:chemotaxis protein CheW [Hwanghaeella sp.]|uniref:chemotaxis protein CheW n=1 Tax=Hwanghaeella sp. TaxID=2605943 RepID=UPI003CCBCBBE
MSNLVVAESTELTMIDEEQLVTMMVDDQLFGIPILKVQDIVEPSQITPVPCAPSAIAGVLNLRGRIVTVIDLRELLGAKEDEARRQMSVTIEHKGDLYTLLVDSIGDVRSLPKRDFDKPPATLDENMRRLCSGVFRLEDNLLVVLDVSRILDEETIMKTPRRTRRRRTIKTGSDGKKSAGSEEDAPAAADDKSDASAGKDGKSGVTAARKSAPANDSAAGKTAPKPAAAAPKPAAPKSAPPKAAAPKPAAKDGGGLVGRLGGQSKVESYADALFKLVMSDPVLSHFAEGQDTGAIGAAFKSFAVAATGGKSSGSLEELKAVLHVLVREEGLDDDHFIAVAKHANEVLSKDRASPEAVHGVLELIDGLRNEIVVH